MPQTFYTEEEYERRTDAMGVMVQMIGDVCYSYSHRAKEVTKQSYRFIPNETIRTIETLRYVQKLLNSKYPSFFDAGCGIGNIVKMAYTMGYSASGIDLDKDALIFAQDIGWSNGRLFEADILTYDEYHKYDVIYYYCPFQDKFTEKQFEEMVEDKMKVGAYLIPCLKQSRAIDKDNRFMIIDTTFRGLFPIWKKVSNKKPKTKEEDK